MTDWREDAICSQTDLAIFFPNKGESARPAKSICRRCPVVDDCREWAITTWEMFGVWGGTSETERRAERRRRGLPRPCPTCHVEPVRHPTANTCESCVAPSTVRQERQRAREAAA